MAGLRMARRFARGGITRVGLTVLAIAWGVALVAAIQLANRAVLRAFVEVIDTMAGRAALEVVSGEGGLIPEETAASVRAAPGVELAVPVVKAAAGTTEGGGVRRAGFGGDLTDGAGERVYGVRVELDDSLVFLSQPDSVALAGAFAAARGLAVGDPIELVTPAGRRTFTVRGLLEPAGVARAYGGNVVVMDLYAAEAAFTRPGFITGVDVVVRPAADVREVAEAIAGRLPAGLRVESPAQRQADLQGATRALRLALQAMGLFGLVAAFLITFNRLSTVFEERAWQHGVLRAVGVRTGAIWRQLLGESLLLGAAGVALGIPLGIGLGRLLVPVIATTSALAYKVVAPDAALALDLPAVCLAAALGLATALVAAALPAWRAARATVAETVRSRGAEQPGGRVGLVNAIRCGAIAVVAAAVVAQAAYPSAAAGLCATGLVAIGTALAARPALEIAGFFFRAGSRIVAGPVSRLAAESLLRNPRRTALTVATLGVGLGCVVWFWTLAVSFQSSLVSALTAAVRADLMLASSHVTAGYVEAPVSEDVLAALARVPGVSAAVGSRVIDWPHGGRRVAIEAIDGRYFLEPALGRWPLAADHLPDVWEHVAGGEAAVVSANFALNFHARVGEWIVLGTPRGPLALRIGGVTAAFESPGGTIQMSRELFRDHWQDRQVNRVGVKAAPGIAVGELRATIVREVAARYDLQVLSSAELIAHYAGEVRRAFAPLHVLAVTVLLVTLLGVADTLLAGVLARTRELGVLRAVGVRRPALARMVLAEALLLGVLGTALALVAGLGLALLWVKETLPYLLGWVLDLHLPLREVPVLVLITVAVTVAAAVLPARRAAHLRPALALRHE